MKKTVTYFLYTYVFFAVLFLLINYLPYTSAKYSSSIPDTLSITVQKPTYNVRLDANGGTGNIPDLTNLKYGTYYTLPANTFTNSVFNFMGWNTDPQGNGITYADEASIRNLTTVNGATVTLYAMWSSGIAELNGVFYQTLTEAMQNVPTNGTQSTINLYGDVAEHISILSTQNVVINLHNHTITNVNESPLINNSGRLEIENGTMTSTYNAGCSNTIQTVLNNSSSGTMIINNLNVSTTGTKTRSAVYNDGGAMTIQGNTSIYNNNDEAQNMKPAVESTGGTLTILSGTIIESVYSNGVQVDAGTLTIGITDNQGAASPEIIGGDYGVSHTNAATVNYLDGTIKGETNSFTDVNSVTIDNNCILNETTDNGYYVTTLRALRNIKFTYNGGVGNELTRAKYDLETVGTLPVPTWDAHTFDGWYTTDGRLIDDNEVITSNAEYIAHWTENPANYLVSIGSNNYTTLQEAIYAPYDEPRTTINLINDMTENVTVPEGKNILLDLQGHTITASSGHVIDNFGTVEVTHGTVLRTGGNDQMVTIKNETTGILTISGGEIEGTSYQALRNYGTVYITGGKIWVTPNVNQGVVNNENGGTMTISGGQIINESKRQAVYNDGGTLTISGDAYLENKNAGTAQTRPCVQNNKGTTYILGGTIISGIQSGLKISGGTAIVGSQGGGVDTTSPSITGATYGVENGKTFKWYDGFLQGKTDYKSGNINARESGYDPQTGTNGDYKTGILVPTS